LLGGWELEPWLIGANKKSASSSNGKKGKPQPRIAAHLGKAMKQIASALVKAQRQFGPALKSSTNPHFKTKYADLSACIEAVIDALHDNGIALVQRNHESESGVTVETVFVHESGETIDCGKLHVPAIKNDPQGYGSAQTYARRYSLMAACGIAPEDDDGNAAQRREPAREPEPRKISEKQAADIEALIDEVGADKVAFLAWVAQMSGGTVAKVADIPVKAIPHVTQALEKKRQQKEHA
jgi:hypothetical protein